MTLQEIMELDTPIVKTRDFEMDKEYHFYIDDLIYEVVFAFFNSPILQQFGGEPSDDKFAEGIANTYHLDLDETKYKFCDLSFALTTKNQISRVDKTGTGNVDAVFSGVKRAVEDFLSYDYTYDIMVFTAKEENRARLYRIFASMLSKQTGFPYEIHYSERWSQTTFYFFNLEKLKLIKEDFFLDFPTNGEYPVLRNIKDFDYMHKPTDKNAYTKRNRQGKSLTSVASDNTGS